MTPERIIRCDIVIKYVFIVHHGVRWETNFDRLSHDRVTFELTSAFKLVTVANLRYQPS